MMVMAMAIHVNILAILLRQKKLEVHAAGNSIIMMEIFPMRTKKRKQAVPGSIWSW